MYGLLRPHFELVLSEIKPIIGSVRASNILGRPPNKPAKKGSIPNAVSKKNIKKPRAPGNKLSTNWPEPKAIFDTQGNALNFSRKISNIATEFTYYKHIGIYAYKKDVLEEICQLQESTNERKERLEQLRWLDNNYTIKVGITNFQTLSVDTPEDIEKIKVQMR